MSRRMLQEGIGHPGTLIKVCQDCAIEYFKLRLINCIGSNRLTSQSGLTCWLIPPPCTASVPVTLYSYYRRALRDGAASLASFLPHSFCQRPPALVDGMSDVLHHEVLLALLGHTGDVIEQRHSGAEVVGYRVSPSLSFIAPAERQRIDGIVQLGFLYLQLHSFILTHTHQPAPSGSDATSPLYLAALSTALSNLLASYRSTLLHVERAVLESDTYPMSSLQQTLQPFSLLFPAIAHTVSRVTAALHAHQQHHHYRQHYQHTQLAPAAGTVASSSPTSSSTLSDSAYVYHGGALLSLLHSYSHTGYPLLAAAYRSLLATVQCTLYSQLECWCLYGELNDPCSEFFIGQRRQRAESQQTAEQPFSAVWERWEVRDRLLPSYITHEVALKLLFVGRAVNILQLDSSPSSLQIQPTTPPSTAATPSSPLFLSPPFRAFQTSLASLRSASVFSLAALDASLTLLHSHLAQRLSSLLFLQDNLIAHLHTLHSFYLLADGHFASFLLDTCAALLSAPPSSHVDRDLNVRLQWALSASNLTSHPHSSLFSLSLDSPSFSVPSFPAPASLSQHLLLAADAVELSGAVRLTGRQGSANGGVWWSERRMVEYGWETRLSVSVAGTAQADDSTCGFAFVVQNEKAVAGLTAQWNKHATTDTNQPFHAGLVNALLIECVRRPASVAEERREQVSVYSVPYPPLVSGGSTAASGQPRCLKAITGNWGLFDTHTHQLHVSYTLSENEADGTLRVSLDSSSSQPLLSVPARLSNLVQLEGGRAYVGFVSSTAPSTATSSPPPPVYLHSWSFNERFPVSQPLRAWRNVRLSYKANGPLTLILRPASFERYLALFRFLLEMQRCHHALQHSFSLLSALKPSWQPLATRPTSTTSTAPPASHSSTSSVSRLLLLRSHITHFISCLHSHLYADVLAPSLQQLMDALQLDKPLDFLSVRRTVDDYLVRCGVGCWVRDRVVRKGVEDVMDLAWKLMGRMDVAEKEAREASQEKAGATQAREEAADSESDRRAWVIAAQAEFERLSSFLFTVWTRKSVLLSNQSLSHLLTRLDGNHLYSRQAIASGLRRLQSESIDTRKDSLLMMGSSVGDR